MALHSFGDFGQAFAELAAVLTAQGDAVYAIDQRGFGGSGELGRWAGTATLAGDLRDLIAAVQAEHPGTPLRILGESMGASVALVVASDDPPPGVVAVALVAPGVREGLRARPLWNALFLTGATLAPAYSVGLEPDREDYTAAARARFRHDPRVLRRVRADTYWGLLSLGDAASAAAYEVRLPVLLLVGGADDYVPPIALCNLARALRSHVTLRVYPDGLHRFLHQQATAPAARVDIARWADGLALPAAGTLDCPS